MLTWGNPSCMPDASNLAAEPVENQRFGTVASAAARLARSHPAGVRSTLLADMERRQREGLRARLTRLRGQLITEGPQKIEPARTDDAAVGVPDEDAQALTEMM